jgi:hypothetical protein
VSRGEKDSIREGRQERKFKFGQCDTLDRVARVAWLNELHTSWIYFAPLAFLADRL